MRDNDIIEKIHGLYDVKEPDVLSRLDFSKIEMVSAPEKSIKKRYFSAVAVYAAACLVVAIALPFIIGGGEEPVKPQPQPGVSMTNTETADTTNEPAVDNSEIIDEFMAALERAVDEGRVEGEFDRSNCFEISTRDVLSETGARLFKFADTNYTFIYADGEAYEAKNSPDSPGTSGAVTWDYDGNGKCDILLSVPQTKTGGVERTSVYVFNMDTKSIVTSRIVLQNWAAVTKAVDSDGALQYPVRDVSYVIDSNKKMLCVPTAGYKLYGFIEFRDGEIVFAEYTSNDPYDETISIDVYPIPVETTEPEVPTPEDPDPAETTTDKKFDPVGTSTTKKSEPGPTPKVYGDPADHVRVHFYKDDAMIDEYKSAADIPYGIRVYYKIVTDPGYICTNFSINVHGVGCDEVKDGLVGTNYYPFFDNNYSGDKLEYSVTAVLAGDADGNLMYDQSDVDTLNKYLDGDTTTLWLYGPDGYSEKLDYNCDGVINVNDRMQLQAEIKGGPLQRGVIGYHKYAKKDIGTQTYRLPLNISTVLPHGIELNRILTRGGTYDVYESTASISELSDEIKAEYDDNFFEHYDLILVYCYTEDDEVPINYEELDAILCTGSRNGTVLNPVIPEVRPGETLSEYAICIAAAKRLNIIGDDPM